MCYYLAYNRIATFNQANKNEKSGLNPKVAICEAIYPGITLNWSVNIEAF